MSEHEHDDGLERYARALRQQSAQSDAALAAQTRARVVASARRSASAPRYALAAAAALAFVLVGGSSVWALYYGELPFLSAPPEAPREVPGAREPSRARPVPAAPEEAPSAERIESPTASASAAPTRPTSEAPAPRAGGEHAAREPERAAPVAHAPAAHELQPVEPAEELEPVDPAERRAYDAAHTAHFEAHDWPRAIEAWRAYIHAYPTGRYVPEARFNIAIALVRSGQREEAREALRPIADGSHGAYRRAEAAALLSALEEEQAGQ